MEIYLIKDYFRIDGITGDPIEKEFIQDFIKYNNSLEIESGKNQFISFQIIFDTHGEEWDNASVDFSDMIGPADISKKEFCTFIEWFHKVNEACVPDCLVPLGETSLEFKVPLDKEYLAEQKVGAIWVDFFIPADTKSGKYRGNIEVAVDDDVKMFDLSINVHDVVIPNESRIIADLNNYADNISSGFSTLYQNKDRYKDGSYFDMEKQFICMSREHRGLFHTLGYRHSGVVVPSYAPEIEGEGKGIKVKNWELFDQHFGPYLDGSAFKDSRWGERPIEFMYMPFNLGWPANYEKWGKKGYATEVRRILNDFVRHFEEKGWTKTNFELFLNHKKDYRFFPYTIDEIWYEHDVEGLEQFYDIIKDVYKDTETKFVFRIDSSNQYANQYDSKYSDMCNMWVISCICLAWLPESVPVMKAKNDIMFIYGGLADLRNSLLSIFTWPMRCFIYGIDGFTLWNVVDWGNDYLNCPNNHGRETLFYPGVKFSYNGPLPSIRLKALRNQMQIGDMIASTNGLDSEGVNLKGKMVKLINDNYGYENSDPWWAKKPDFLDIPPRYWDWSGIPPVSIPDDHKGKSPVIIERIARDALKLLERVYSEELNVWRGESV